jgi:hypothetical protein
MKRILMLVALALVMAAIIVTTGVAQAQTPPQGTLDADNLNHQPSSMGAITTEFASGQTFTVTRSGKLTGARVWLSKVNSSDALTVEIAKVDAGSGFPAVPEEVVASTIKPASTFPPGSNTLGSLQPVDIVFETPASVVAGDHYALILKARGVDDNVNLPDGYNIGATGDPLFGGGNTYPGGEWIYQRCPFGAVPGSGCDTPPTQWQTPYGTGGPDLIFGIYVATDDTTPPKVISTFPGNGGEVGPAANIRATFSEDMRPASVMNAFKLFRKGSTNQLDAVVTYDAATDIATLNPNNDLRRGATYKAVATTVAKDMAGNRLDQDSSTAGLQKKVWFFEID